MHPAVLALATARLSLLITQDKITDPLRNRIFAWADQNPSSSARATLAYLPTCMKCTSIWAALALHAATNDHAPAPIRHPARFLAAALALSEAALITDTVRDRIER